MIKKTCHFGILVLLFVNAVFLSSHLRNLVSWPLQSLDAFAIVAQLPLAAKVTEKRVTVRACLIFYDGIPNYEVFKAWIEYHNKRWGLTHVDVFVTEKMSDMMAILNFAAQDSVKIEVFYTHLHDKPVLQHYFGQRQTTMMNRVLHNAKLDNNTFILYSDPDEFLVSDDFRDFEQMFERGHDAVTFAKFGSSYHICSDNALHFGSLGYQSVVPHSSNFSNNATLEYYTDPKVACSGHRKFVVRADKWDHIDYVHDPLKCSRTVMDSRVFRD